MLVSMLFCGEMSWNADVVSTHYISGLWNSFKHVSSIPHQSSKDKKCNICFFTGKNSNLDPHMN